ncbi:MAG TPA: Hsp20/alpha crystallin family protein [Elusimicrobiota bacterium]|nr:Hsp20/alpha crystallin family protein [Elusimicrobiota bacterium]
MAKELSKKTEAPAAVKRAEQDPFREMISFRDTINGMFEDFFSGRPLLASALPEPSILEQRGWAPPVDIRETGDELIVYAGLLGIKKEDCKIEVKDDVLILSGERKDSPEGAQDWLRREMPHGEFYRAFTLPTNVKSDQVKARYSDGVLEIRLPKSEEAKSRSITIE